MTPAGWLIMTVSLCSVLGLTAFCLWRVLTLPSVELMDLHSKLDIETPDPHDAE